jgi:hypothetical protein
MAVATVEAMEDLLHQPEVGALLLLQDHQPINGVKVEEELPLLVAGVAAEVVPGLKMRRQLEVGEVPIKVEQFRQQPDHRAVSGMLRREVLVQLDNGRVKVPPVMEELRLGDNGFETLQ